MIIIRLDRILADRKVKLRELANEIDITIANLSNLKTGKVKAIRFSTLDGHQSGIGLRYGGPFASYHEVHVSP